MKKSAFANYQILLHHYIDKTKNKTNNGANHVVSSWKWLLQNWSQRDCCVSSGSSNSYSQIFLCKTLLVDEVMKILSPMLQQLPKCESSINKNKIAWSFGNNWLEQDDLTSYHQKGHLHGSIPQDCLAYSSIVLSLLNLPEPAVLRILLQVQLSWFTNSLSALACNKLLPLRSRES